MIREHLRPAWRRTVPLLFCALSCIHVQSGCRPADRDGGDSELPKGTELPNLLREGRLRNAPVDAAAPQSGWIIYAFSPRSSVCSSNSPRATELAGALPAGWAFLSVATDDDGLASFLERHRVSAPVVTQVPAITLAKYRVKTTPRTYILDLNWKLVGVLDGQYQGQVAQQLVRRFNVHLRQRPTAGAVSATPRQNAPDPPGIGRNLCLDTQQRPYSPGAAATAMGLKIECGSGGLWIPVA